MLHRALREALTVTSHRVQTTGLVTTVAGGGILGNRRHYAAKPPKPSKSSKSVKLTKQTIPKHKRKPAKGKGGAEDAGPTAEVDAEVGGEQLRLRLLAEDDKNESLDLGPHGKSLFTSTPSISLLSRSDTCSYMRFTLDRLNTVLPEGLPPGMLKEFEDSKRCALLVRQSFLDLRDNFRRIVDPPSFSSSSSKASKAKKQIVLDGPRSCGKSVALAMLAHWARDEGWLVFYVPKGREWTHGGYFYKNPDTDSWDTPLQAENTLKDFLKFNETRLQQLPCQVNDPIPLGEGAGVGFLTEDLTMTLPDGSTLFDLVQTGVNQSHAAVGVLVHLRKELSLVKDIPVLIAIDQYNCWFTFSEYNEVVTPLSCRQVHARELATIKAFRPMRHNDMMVGAFSHSTAVGKLRQDLPGVPVGARINFPRYSLDEAGAVCHYYLRQRLINRDVFSEEKWKKMYYLANGNGSEMRTLAPLMW